MEESLRKVPGRYRALLHDVLTEYAGVGRLEHDKGGTVELEVEFDRGERMSWHFEAGGKGEFKPGAPEGKETKLLHIRVSAERLRTAMESGKTIREVAFACNPHVHGDIDYAFRALAYAEKVRARGARKGD